MRDCPPFKSELSSALKDTQRTAWNRAFETATSREANPRQALEFYRQAEAIDGGHALLNYRMARCFDRLNEMKQAADYYIRAKDTDVCPLRMVEKNYQSLLKISKQTKTPLVDVRVGLEKLTPDGIPGYDQYMDHVHPTIRTHQFIAESIADRMEQLKWIAENKSLTDKDRRKTYRKYIVTLDKRYLVNGRRRVSWLEKWARRSRLVIETEPFDARGYLELGKRRLLFGENEYAWDEFDNAIAIDPQYVDSLLAYAQSFFHGGYYLVCRDMLDELQKHEAATDYQVRVDLALLIVALELGENKEVVELYQKRSTAFDDLAKTNPPWLQAMPDALQRARNLATETP